GHTGQTLTLARATRGPINVSDWIQAEQGEADIRQTADTGQTTLNNATIHGDVVKLSALGTNGVLNIGSGNMLNADTVLKLYAVGSNGTLNLLSNVPLSRPPNMFPPTTI